MMLRRSPQRLVPVCDKDERDSTHSGHGVAVEKDNDMLELDYL